MMTRNSLIFLWLVSILLGSCKRKEVFTVAELRDLSEMNADDFDSFVMSKGYELQTGHEEERYFYSKKSKEDKVDPHDDIVSWEQEKGDRIVSYQSCDKEYYVRIKEEIKSLGFVFISPDSTLEKMDEKLYYKKAGTSLMLVTIPKSDENDLKATIYRIEIKQPIDKPRIQ